MPNEEGNFEGIIETLTRHEVDFILVGGYCGTLHGAPVPTYDVDIVQSRAPENLERLENALRELGAYYREHTNKRILPEAERMTTLGHHLLNTTFGHMDVLGAIAKGRDYANLEPHTIKIALTDALVFRMLDLETLILTKEETGRDKDKLVLPILKQIQKELERK